MSGLWVLIACTDAGPGGKAPGLDSYRDSKPVESPALDDTSGDDTAAADDTGTTVPLDAPVVYWGDLHSHSNLSQDGCEDPDDECVPDGDLPGEEVFERAAARGLSFVGLTEHTEFESWVDLDVGEVRSIWDETLRLVHHSEDTGVIGIVGYEWAAEPITGYDGSHRTVLLEAVQPCDAYRVSGGRTLVQPKVALEREEYVDVGGALASDPSALALLLEETAARPGCQETRVVSYFHHPAFTPPQPTYWSDPLNDVGDVVVEMLSEHGSSECADPAMPGCDWFLREEYIPEGSVQTALQLGYKLGFVGGTDNHEADPGSVQDGPGPIAHLHDDDGDGVLEARWQDYAGGLTGVWSDAPLDRAVVFDAILARNTIAASWPFERVLVRAVALDGTAYLPGDDLPAGSYLLEISLPGYDYVAELVDPMGTVSEPDELNLAEGEIYYVRLKADVDGVEQRVFASPFFGI